MGDSLIGLVDFVMKWMLYVIIPVGTTLTLISQYFQTVKVDNGDPGKFSDYIKKVFAIFGIAIVAWVAIYIARTLLPAAGSSVVGELGF
jgi:uncharacterized membrane-anchored protein